MVPNRAAIWDEDALQFVPARELLFSGSYTQRSAGEGLDFFSEAVLKQIRLRGSLRPGHAVASQRFSSDRTGHLAVFKFKLAIDKHVFHAHGELGRFGVSGFIHDADRVKDGHV